MRYFKTLQFAREHRKNPTLAEKTFWEKVRGRKFYGLKFNRQFIIEYKEILGNKLFYIADFHNFENKVIVELDGEIHKKQVEYDRERQANLESVGFRVIRFTNDEVLGDWEDVSKRLMAFIDGSDLG